MKTLGYILLGALVLPALPVLLLGSVLYIFGSGLYMLGEIAWDVWHS